MKPLKCLENRHKNELCKLILSTLKANNNNLSKAARILGVSRDRLAYLVVINKIKYVKRQRGRPKVD